MAAYSFTEICEKSLAYIQFNVCNFGLSECNIVLIVMDNTENHG